jgi:ubiquinone/menaquinone biosynthesis C-methylase UbiE
MAAELVKPGGSLICSDGSEPMLEVARDRARRAGIDNVEFKRLQLEWIDLETATVDAILCRWGLMLVIDPAAAAHEMRRVLAPGGRIAVAVWDAATKNPWATVPNRALMSLGRATPMEETPHGMFSLGAPGQLRDLLESAGFVDVRVESIELDRTQTSVAEFMAETRGLSQMFATAVDGLAAAEQAEVERLIGELSEPYLQADGTLRFPGWTLVGSASA